MIKKTNLINRIQIFKCDSENLYTHFWSSRIKNPLSFIFYMVMIPYDQPTDFTKIVKTLYKNYDQCLEDLKKLREKSK